MEPRKARKGEVDCEICGSPHGPNDYSTGWYIDSQGKVRKLSGHKKITEAMLDPNHEAGHVFWTEEAVRSYLDAQLPPQREEVGDDGGR